MSAATRRGTSITTYSGRRVWPLELKTSDIKAIDVAHHLSNMCRYNGAVDFFYSVAQHSCLVHDYGPDDPDIKKQLLVHDFPEYVIGDMVAPLKHTENFDFYRELEAEIEIKVCEKFDVVYPFDPIVKEIDLAIREREIRDLKKGQGHSRRRAIADRFEPITYWSPKKSKNELIKRMKSVGIEVEDV